jgi:hypothetical protein
MMQRYAGEQRMQSLLMGMPPASQLILSTVGGVPTRTDADASRRLYLTGARAPPSAVAQKKFELCATIDARHRRHERQRCLPMEI